MNEDLNLAKTPADTMDMSRFQQIVSLHVRRMQILYRSHTNFLARCYPEDAVLVKGSWGEWMRSPHDMNPAPELVSILFSPAENKWSVQDMQATQSLLDPSARLQHRKYFNSLPAALEDLVSEKKKKIKELQSIVDGLAWSSP